MSTAAINDLFNQAPIEEPVSLVTVELINFLAMELPARELILSPWLPEAGLCMIHAFRGIGKTHLSLGIACAVAKGGKFLDWEAPTPRNVLYIDGEMPASVLQDRLAKIIVMMGDDHLPGRLNIITPDLQKFGMPDIATKEGQALIDEYITDDTDLIIIDNLSCLAPSIKENDANDWSNIQTWVLNLRAKGKSVLLIHHSGKAGAQRGTSRKEDVLDTVITLERPKDYDSSQGARFIVKFEKSRGFFGDDAKPFEAQLCNDEKGDSNWSITSIEESTYEKVVSMLNQNMSHTDIKDELGVNKSTVSRHATRARQEGLLKSPLGVNYG